jgi:MFS family permease
MKPRSILTLGNFFASAHFFLIVYIITPYLATFMPDSQTGLVVSLGAIITLSVFPFMPELVRRYGARQLGIFFALVETFVLGWLAVGPTPLPAIILVACAVATTPLLEYQLDLLLEATVAKEDATGRVRTLFLTAGNIALVFSPLVAGLILDSGEAYWRVFAIAASSLLPFIFLLSTKRLPPGQSPNLISMMGASLMVMGDKDLRAVVLSHGALQLFYHLAPLYIPLYLHHILRIPWEQLGWIFAVMLLPFVLLEYPAGWLADRRFGDKEILILGFIIMTLGFAALALVTADTMMLWIVLILVVNRIGASLVEAMTEGHFFRRVSEADASTVGIFRMTRPVAALLGPILGCIILSISDYASLFVITSIIIAVIGISSGLKIKDIR